MIDWFLLFVVGLVAGVVGVSSAAAGSLFLNRAYPDKPIVGASLILVAIAMLLILPGFP